ncbi:3-methyl-2-oxobutanoate dehydrogenase subunit beta [Vulcanisaeta thermophila]|uniref:3-methyl-2-oxobutanoate dehydrogenase subunit beta n=1 Tax=Vulcanisaeta thermophila TaxID=867917 RepID=UPI000A005A46|nr:3-methyl-2-oxobutanoate dehydrogenase subunit beta [Vulcanisaeta thermophila]
MVTMTELHRYGRTKFIMPGTAACPGCPLQVGMRQLAMALDGKMVMVIPAGCSSVIPGTAPNTAYTWPTLHVPFASSPAVASGLVRALRQRGVDGPVVVWAGDGGTADIGFATLSGAAYRNDDVLYIMADNEAYMNTGIQASGTTPWMAWTTTSPSGKTEERKEVDLIMLMHKIPYVATASIAFPMDFIDKVRRAVSIRGFKFIHLHTPCPPGWKMDDSYTIRAARLAVETGAWILWEYNQGRLTISPPSIPYKDKSRRRPLEEYLKIQGRFAHLKPEDVKAMEERIDKQWDLILKLAEIFK